MLTGPPLVAVSTKAYFGVEQTRRWVGQVAALPRTGPDLGVELGVLPSLPLLESTAATLAGTGIAWGAQNCAASDDGAQTGEVPAGLLRELGCTYVEVGHAERRSRLGESDQIVQDKVARILAHGMTPLLCVGEAVQTDPAAAATWCIGELRHALNGHDDGDVVVAYEPRWAIGAAHPAPAEYVVTVASALREALADRAGSARVLYGGAAGPGTATALGGSVDGLFLGRFAHDVDALHRTLREVAALHEAAPEPPATALSRPRNTALPEGMTP